MPEIVGGFVYASVPASLTAALALVATVFEPSAFEAVTRTRRRLPTSMAAGMYLSVVAPPIAAQFDASAAPPEAGQRVHWNSYDVGASVQLPLVAVNVEFTTGVPVIRGSTVFSGTPCDCAEPVPTNVAASARSKIDTKPSRCVAW